MVLPFWCRLTQVVLEKMPLNGCVGCVLASVDVMVLQYIHALLVLNVIKHQRVWYLL